VEIVVQKKKKKALRNIRVSHVEGSRHTVDIRRARECIQRGRCKWPTSVLRRTVLRCTYTEVDKGGRVALNTIHAESAAMGNDLFIGTAHDGSAGTCKIGQSKISKVISIYLEC
jgi:hypothetical protein